MANKVNPTPTLTGENVDYFIKKLNTPFTKEEIKGLEIARKTFKAIEFER